MEIAISNPSEVLGHLVSDSDRVELCLFPNELLKIDADIRGLQVTCLRGRPWITQVNDEQDYILQAGERFVVTKPGLVIVQSFSESMIRVISPIAKK